MPVAGLTALRWRAEMLKLTNPSSPSFRGWPATTADAAVAWADVAKAYFSEIMMPPIVAPTHDLAHAAFVPAFLAAEGLAALTAGLTAYAGVLAASVPTSTPPPAPPVWPTLPNTSDPILPASLVALAVQAWAVTGTGPTPASLPWS